MRTLVLASLLAALPASAQSLCDQIRGLTQDPAVASAHWGVSVTSLDGTVLCGVNEAQLFRPASNNKIFTSAAALALLGPERRFTTRVDAEGKLTGSSLRGNLILVGAGDANFGGHDIPYVPPAQRPRNPAPEPSAIADIESLADQVAASGLRTVLGDIVGDDRQFEYEPYPPDWTIEDALYGYGAPVSALTIHDNQLEIDVFPGNDRGTASAPRAILKTVPALPYYTLDNRVYTQDMGQDCDARLGFRRAAGSKLLTVFGDIPPNPAPGAQPCRQNIAIADPSEYAAQALKAALERRGIRVTGVARAQHHDMLRLGSQTAADPSVYFMLPRLLASPERPQPVTCEAQRVSNPGDPPDLERRTLAAHNSPPLLDDLVYTLKVSQNLHAELMLRNLGASFSCDHTQAAGLSVIREFLLHAGVGPTDFVLYDGSGLSAHDLVAPRAFTTFLLYAATQPWFENWKAALPGGGVDGTLNARFGKTLPNRVFAKTGTLSETRALSGYVLSGGGQTIIFSVMVDTHQPNTPADRTVMDHIVELIANSR